MSTPEQTPAPQAPRRQYVNFAFYKIDPAWRRLPESERTRGKQEFLRAVEDYTGKVLVVAYSAVGIRGDCDIMLWRISYEMELFQDMTTKILASGLGQYLTTPYSYLLIFVGVMIHIDRALGNREIRVRRGQVLSQARSQDLRGHVLE